VRRPAPSEGAQAAVAQRDRLVVRRQPGLHEQPCRRGPAGRDDGWWRRVDALNPRTHVQLGPQLACATCQELDQHAPPAPDVTDHAVFERRASTVCTEPAACPTRLPSYIASVNDPSTSRAARDETRERAQSANTGTACPVPAPAAHRRHSPRVRRETQGRRRLADAARGSRMLAAVREGRSVLRRFVARTRGSRRLRRREWRCLGSRGPARPRRRRGRTGTRIGERCNRSDAGRRRRRDERSAVRVARH
jgi:hypothetical protein